MAEIEYDEGSGTFAYFIVLIYGLFLLIVSYFLWPRNKKSDGGRLVCQCGPCCQKRNKTEKKQTLDKLLKILRILVLIIFWAILIWLIYWAVTQETETEEWDPYAILGVDRGATTSEIKKKYRQLSKTHHPDKGGDPEVFTKIAKAYEALTNEEARENWEKYGNPDGPRAASFGVALPSWIIDKDNSLWVLGGYVAVFMIGLPIIVGTWWYRSVKYGTTNILLATSQMYMQLLARAKTIPLKRVIMILSTAIEFTNNNQAGVKDRPSDDIYLNQLVKELDHSIKVDTREQPFCRTYVAKTRLLLHAHFEHIEFQDPGLKQDQDAIVKYSPFLINEMMNMLTQVWVYSKVAKANRNPRKIPEPSLDMYETTMRVSQLIVQALWVPFDPMIQLPHIKPEHSRFFMHKRHKIATIGEFVTLKPNERRRILKGLSDDEYRNVMIFCENFPHISMRVKTEVADDEDTTLISAGSYVTIKVHLKRTGQLKFHGKSVEKELRQSSEEGGGDNEEEQTTVGDKVSSPDSISFEEDKVEANGSSKPSTTSGKPQQQRNKKKGKGQKGGGGGGGKKKKQVPKKQKQEPQKEDKIEEVPVNNDDDSDVSDKEDEELHSLDDEEREWRELQKSVKKERDQLKNQSMTSPLVHAPYFPADKHELWWVYVGNKKTNSIIIPPERVAGLTEEKEVSLRTCMERKGLYKYTVYVTSDSYLNYTVQQDITIKVHEKREVSGKEQWQDLEKEEEEEDMIEESITESESESEESD